MSDSHPLAMDLHASSKLGGLIDPWISCKTLKSFNSFLASLTSTGKFKWRPTSLLLPRGGRLHSRTASVLCSAAWSGFKSRLKPLMCLSSVCNRLEIESETKLENNREKLRRHSSASTSIDTAVYILTQGWPLKHDRILIWLCCLLTKHLGFFGSLLAAFSVQVSDKRSKNLSLR